VENGVWIHKRIDSELSKSKRLKQAKSEAGKLGMASRWNNTVNNSVISEGVTKNNPSPSPSPSQEVNPPNRGFPRMEEVLSWAEMDGIDKSDAERFFHHFDSTGWIDKNSNRIINARSKLRIWATDKRGHNEEHRQSTKTLAASNSVPSFWETNKQLELVDKEINAIKQRASHTATSILIQPGDREPLKVLKAKRSELKKRLGLT
jgi:uncharacterized protein YdaU (DUF1376 family)